MKLSGSPPVFFAAFGLALNLGAATDYSRRNEAFAPAARLAPPVSFPATAPSIQDSRAPVPATTVEKTFAALGDRRAPVAVSETHEKKIFPLETRQLRPVSRPLNFSRSNRPPARFSPAADARPPAFVAKYQDRLSAGNTVMIGRTPALDRSGTARLNRFVFRHPPSEPPSSPAAAAPSGAAAPADER